MDFGFHSSIARALLTHISGQECFERTLRTGIDELKKSINNLDSRLDKQRFLEYNNAAFMLPKKFEFQGHKGDEVSYKKICLNLAKNFLVFKSFMFKHFNLSKLPFFFQKNNNLVKIRSLIIYWN